MGLPPRYPHATGWKTSCDNNCDNNNCVQHKCTIIRRHRWKRFRLLISMLLFRGLCGLSLCLFVCLSGSCIVLKWQKLSTRFLLLTTAPCLAQIVLKFGLHRSTPSFPNFAPKRPTFTWFERRRQSVDRDIAQSSQWRAYRKPPSLFRMVPQLIPTTCSFPEIGSQMRPRDQLRDACCHLANVTEDIDKISFEYDSPIEICRLCQIICCC